MKIQVKMDVHGAHVTGDGMMQMSMVEVRDEKATGQPINGSLSVPADFAREALGRQFTLTMNLD